MGAVYLQAKRETGSHSGSETPAMHRRESLSGRSLMSISAVVCWPMPTTRARRDRRRIFSRHCSRYAARVRHGGIRGTRGAASPPQGVSKCLNRTMKRAERAEHHAFEDAAIGCSKSESTSRYSQRHSLMFSAGQHLEGGHSVPWSVAANVPKVSPRYINSHRWRRRNWQMCAADRTA
jgi:hypothetical protein